MTGERTPEGDSKGRDTPTRLTSEDAARILSSDPDWGGRPTLNREQEDELLALIKPALMEGGELRFRQFANLIFAAAVERYCTFGGESPRLILREEINAAVLKLRDPQAVVEAELSPVIQEVIEAALENKMPTEVRSDGSLSSWFRNLPPEARRCAQLRALKGVEVEVKTGPSYVLDRLMVRGLAALLRDVTGVVPGRTHRADSKKGGPIGESYWFLNLANRLSVLVNQALPPDQQRRGVTSLTGIVAGELRSLKRAPA